MVLDPNVLIALAILLGVALAIGWTLAAFRRGRSATATDLRNPPRPPVFAETYVDKAVKAEAGEPVVEQPAETEPPADASGSEETKAALEAAPLAQPVAAVSPGDKQIVLIGSLEDGFAILAAIRGLSPETKLDIILHTEGGDAFPAELIAQAVKERQHTTAYVPYRAKGVGALIALSAQTVVMGRYASLGPIETQFHGFPAESYIRLLKEKPLHAIADEVVLLGYLAESALKAARIRAFSLVNWVHFGLGEGRALLDALAFGDGAPISRTRAIGLGVRVAESDCPAEIYALVEQALPISKPAEPAQLGFAASDFPAAGKVPQDGADAEVIRHLVNAASGYVLRHTNVLTRTKAHVSAMEGDIRAYLKEIFDNLPSFIDSHWPVIAEKILAAFPE